MERSETPEQHLWSSILDSVSSSRAIPSKNVILLGEPSSGKTTLCNALLQKSQQHERSRADQQADGSSRDFALGYEWGNVKDEADEDTLARLSLYSVPSSSPAHLALLPHFLPPKSALPQTLVMIVLDWMRPSTFVDQLKTWLAWVDRWSKGNGARELEVLREEGKERLQSHLQHYAEPTANPESIPTSGANVLSSTLLPLSQGVFTHNASGVPIIVVCTKADRIDDDLAAAGMGGGLGGVVKSKGADWEERTDGIMQVLRTICLKYGAGLFYTSSSQPISLVQLRAYTLHLLFMPPPPAPDQPPLKYLFPFRQRPNLLDRDRIAIPAGWDSWGKIGVVRDGFDCPRWEEAWERDVEEGAGQSVSGGASEKYRALVGVMDVNETAALPPLITTEPEQSFLARQYEALAKDRDPRQQFREPQNPGEQPNAGVVGPMGASSFSLPTVEKAMTQMEGEDITARLARMGGAANGPRRETRGTAPSLAPLAVPHTQPNGALAARQSLSASVNFTAASPVSNPASPGAISATGGKSQHDVLQEFFQSLLQKGERGGGASANAPSPLSANPAAGGAAPSTASAMRSPPNGATSPEPPDGDS